MSSGQNNQREEKIVPTLRHCMVVHAYYPLGETRVEREAQALIREGHQVDVICLRDDGESPEEVVDGVTTYRLPVQRSKRKGLAVQLIEYLTFFLFVFVKLSALQLRRRYHVVQVHNLPDFLIFAALTPKLVGASLILDLHDLMPEFYAGRFETDLSSLPVRLVILQEQLSCKFADHIITVSDHWRQALIERGVPPEKCSVVMNVADEEIFYWSDDYADRAARNGRFRLIYHGTIVQRYGLDLAVEAINQVKNTIPNIELVILGKGDHVSALKKMVRTHNLEQNVTIHNELRPAQELPQIIRTADLGIVPYRNDPFTDGLLPTKLMEYAALGVPAIAARTTAIEMYFKGTMVMFFEPGDVKSLTQCICNLYSNPEKLIELAHKSRKFNERYCWTKTGEEYNALVARLSK